MAKKPTKNYFSKETEDAILKYNRPETNLEEKNRIYSKYIHYPFFKLTQNIIHTFKFYNTDVDDLEHLQHEIEVFLLEKIHLYHHSKSIDDRLHKIINKKHFHNCYTRGEFLEYTNHSDEITLDQIRSFITTYKDKVSSKCWEELTKLTPPKAFSYFGTIVKRYLINYNKKNYTKKIHKSPIEDLTHDINHSYDNILKEDTLYQDNLSIFFDLYIEYIDNNIEEIFTKQQDILIADIFMDMFKKRENIDIFNKKALYFNIREKGDFKTPKITKVSDKLKDIFEKNYIFYIEEGYIDFENS